MFLKRVHVTETWIFASEDGKHDVNSHVHALAKVADHYLHDRGMKQQPPHRRQGRRVCTCSRMDAPSSTKAGAIFALWRGV